MKRFSTSIFAQKTLFGSHTNRIHFFRCCEDIRLRSSKFAYPRIQRIRGHRIGAEGNPLIYQILNYLQWVCKYTYTATSTAATATYCYILLQLLLLLLPTTLFRLTVSLKSVRSLPNFTVGGCVVIIVSA